MGHQRPQLLVALILAATGLVPNGAASTRKVNLACPVTPVA